MRIRSVQDIEALKEAVGQCSRAVWLESVNGDKYDLKSEFSQYIAIGALIQDTDEQLELFAADPRDQMIMMELAHKLCA